MTPDALAAALDYVRSWLEYQRRMHDLPGIAVAVARDGEVVLDWACGAADLATGEAFTPRHRFRVASHSKTFTAAGIMLLRERGALGLDDPAGRHVAGLHPEVASATLAQLLSHGAGLIRNGWDSGYFADHIPFPDRAALAADLARPPVIAAETRLKYSNHGFALLGAVIEAVTGEAYADWMAREVVAAFGLTETLPDAPIPPGTPFARGHTHRHPVGARLTIPGENPTHAYAAATGFVSTAADLARFAAALSPEAAASPLSVASRRAMARRHWRDPHVPFERHYGLGTISGALDGWEWFGHSGSFQGYSSRTAVVPAHGIAASVLVNGITAPAEPLLDGVLHVLKLFATRGAPTEAVRDWTGRWCNVYATIDLLPVGDRVLAALPAFWDPVGGASEIAVEGPDRAVIVQSSGFGSQGEPVERVRGPDGAVAELWLAAGRCLPEEAHAAELRARYAGAPAA